jgi:hypothetical protein
MKDLLRIADLSADDLRHLVVRRYARAFVTCTYAGRWVGPPR